MPDPDPLWDVRPGDRAPITHYPSAAVCGERWDRHRCERFPDHNGQHIAGHPHVTAVWIRRTIAANGLTPESTPQDYAKYRTLLAYPGLTGADVDELDLPDEDPDSPEERLERIKGYDAGDQFDAYRELVRDVLVQRLLGTAGHSDSDRRQVNSILEPLGLAEVPELRDEVTVQVTIKRVASTRAESTSVRVRDAIEGGGLPVGYELGEVAVIQVRKGVAK